MYEIISDMSSRQDAIEERLTNLEDKLQALQVQNYFFYIILILYFLIIKFKLINVSFSYQTIQKNKIKTRTIWRVCQI